MYTTLYNQPPEEIPSVNYVSRRSCIVREVIGETMAAIKLVQAPSWDQLWTDATTQRGSRFHSPLSPLTASGQWMGHNSYLLILLLF